MNPNLSLSAKINLIIVAAVLVPLLLLGALTFQTVRNIALANLESFVLENGSRRQAAIESDLRASLSILNDVTSANENLFILHIEQRNSGIQDEAQEELREDIRARFRSQLLAEGYYNSVYLLDRNFTPIVTVLRDGYLESDSLNEQRAAASAIESRLSIANGDIQSFGVASRNEVKHVEVLTAILFEDENGNQQVSGYIFVDLDLDEIFNDNLQRNEAALDTYAYVMLDQGNIIVAPENTLALVDTSSTGAERANQNRASAVTTYEVGDEDNRQEVVGYSATVVIDNEVFALVSEISTNQLFASINDQTIGQVFVLVIGLSVFVISLCLLAANQIVLPPLRNLRTAILAIIRGDFEAPVAAASRKDEIGSLATSFVDMREYIRDMTSDMERRLQARTRDVQVTQDIAKAVTAERDLNTLLTNVVNLITRNFPSIYHAQIFLIDEEQKYAVLWASTGAAGRELLSRGHKLGVGSVSVIGQVTEQGQVVVARDTAESNLHRQNEFLGDTRAELAIPLRLADMIIGALDVQSKQRDSFSEDQVVALQTLADQITIAIENTRLYAESARLLRETELERRQGTRRAWQQHLYEQRQSELASTSGANTGYNFKRLSDAVFASGEPIVGEVTSRNTVPFVVPIVLRGETLGVVEYEVPKVDFEYDKVLLAKELVSRLAISLENARLFQSSQQATERERVVNEISAKLTSQTDIESILQTAVREIEQALRTPQVAIRLAGVSETAKNGNGNGQVNGNGATMQAIVDPIDEPSI